MNEVFQHHFYLMKPSSVSHFNGSTSFHCKNATNS